MDWLLRGYELTKHKVASFLYLLYNISVDDLKNKGFEDEHWFTLELFSEEKTGVFIVIKEIISVGLPVHEHISIKRNRLEPIDAKGNEKRVAIVSGINGDELEGQFVCYELVRRIKEKPDCLKGVVDIYPCLNPLGMDASYRNVPKLDIDMNRIFPGNKKGTFMEQIAAKIVDDIIGADLCIDLHSSDSYIREIPQVRLSEQYAEKLIPYAKFMNVDIIWTNATRTVETSSLAYSLNMLGVPAMVVEMGIGNHINQENGKRIVEGIFQLLKSMGMWTGPVSQIGTPIISRDGEVDYIRADTEGIFLSEVSFHQKVEKGTPIGSIVNPLSGECKEILYAEKEGVIFSLREAPIVYEGTLLARIISGIQGIGEEKGGIY